MGGVTVKSITFAAAIAASAIGRFVLEIFQRPKKCWKLSIYRTNWKFGKPHSNILTIGVIINGLTIPVVWRALPQTNKNGNSNTKLRMELINEFLGLIPASAIDVLRI